MAVDKAKATGWLTLKEGEAYYKTLAPNREFYIFRDEDGTYMLWWGWWLPKEKKPIKEKTLATGLTFDRAINRANSYIEWWFKRAKKGS